MTIVVKQGEVGFTTNTISTSGLAPCYFFLLDGVYNDGEEKITFAYLNHQPKWFEPGAQTPLGLLYDLLKKIFDQFVHQGRNDLSLKNKFSFYNLNNIQLLIGGGRAGIVDPLKDAFSLLIGPDATSYNKIKSMFNKKQIHVLDQLIGHTTILAGLTYQETDEDEAREQANQDSAIRPPAGWVEYDCLSKKGIIGLRWTSLFGTFDLAHMQINLLAKKEEQNYRWEVQIDLIKQISDLIANQDYEISALGRAFSVISDTAIYPSTPAPLLIEASELANKQLNDLHQLKASSCAPKDIIRFSLLRSKNDFTNGNIHFQPKYTDLIFGKDKTVDYENFFVHIYCLSSSITFYFEIMDDNVFYSQEYQKFKNSCINSLNKWIPKTSKNFNSFMSNLKSAHEYSTFGEQMLTYTLKTEESSSFFVYRVNQNLFSDQKFFEWYCRLEKFLVFFINAASTIKKEDPNWIIYLLYQQYQNDTDQTCYAPIGFTKVYLHDAYPDKKRAKISQMLVLPLYQRKGHGRRLLTTIYNDLRQDSRVEDITAEDPSNEFVALHDLVSLELCHKCLPHLFSKESILNNGQLTKEMIDQTRDFCKLDKEQVQRVHEMCFLQSINRNDEEQMKQFHSLVKQRISNEYTSPVHHYENILATFEKHKLTVHSISNILSN